MTNEIKLTEAAIEAWKDDIVLPMDEWKARGVALMRAGLPNAKLREAAEAAKDWAGRMSVADFRSKWNVHNDIEFWRVASGTFVHDMLDDALAAVPADQPHVKDCSVLPRQMTEAELCAVTTDVARLTKERDEMREQRDNAISLRVAANHVDDLNNATFIKVMKERDEARALLADLQATNIAMQADRDDLHTRVEGLKADLDEAIEQRDSAQLESDEQRARAEVAEDQLAKASRFNRARDSESQECHDFGVMQVGETVTHITKCPTCGTQVSLSATVAPIGDDHWKRVAEWLLEQIKGGA